MFSIIPCNNSTSERNDLYSYETSVNSYVSNSSKLLVPGRVTATTGIPQGSMSLPIEPKQLIGSPDVVQISVGVNEYGTLELEERSKNVWFKDIHWIRAFRLADDCHSYNVQLRLQPSQRPCSILNKNIPTPKLIIQAVRPIEAGQELLLWFSEDILAMLQIAFLSPANIQGQKKYVCVRCSALYESPNPLKLHISLGCGRFSISSMWEKLSKLLTETNTTNCEKDGFNFKLEPENIQATQRSAIDLSVNISPSNMESSNSISLYRPYSEPSAFKPFQKIDNNNLVKYSYTVEHLPNLIHGWQVVPFEQNRNEVVSNDEAQIETLVSSLGKSKQGHICLYCGKCYSRKYGLKIHIRTHTGYKPLKCKFCLRPFGDPSNLNKHVRLHAEGDTPYKCDLCGKVLVRRRDLERHLKSRHMSDMHPGTNILNEGTNEDIDTSEEEEKKIFS